MSELVDPDVLREVVSIALARSVRLGEWSAVPVPYQMGSPATAALLRISGVTDDGAPWSVFLKGLQHPRHWPGLHLVPAEFREGFVRDFPWRGELVAWESPFACRLPAGLRIPQLYRIVDLGDDRLAVWMEDIRTVSTPWDVPRFARAAWLLGAFAARRADPDLLSANGSPGGGGLRLYCATRVRQGALPALADDRVWAHPLLAGAVDARLRADLRTLANRLPATLDRLDALPQALPHGDASPQNLLVPAERPDTMVAIDVSFQSPHAVGFDLGQLLVGLVHAGSMPAASLAAVHAVLVPSFVDGAAAYGARWTAAQVSAGYVGSLVVRAGFTSLPLERLAEPATPELAAVFRERAALTRFIADLALGG